MFRVSYRPLLLIVDLFVVWGVVCGKLCVVGDIDGRSFVVWDFLRSLVNNDSRDNHKALILGY